MRMPVGGWNDKQRRREVQPGGHEKNSQRPLTNDAQVTLVKSVHKKGNILPKAARQTCIEVYIQIQ